MSTAITYLIIQAIVLWLASLWLKDSSLFDRFWALSFVVIAWLLKDEVLMSISAEVYFAMLNFWGLRLSWHITRRNWGRGEDRRYADMRKRIPGYSWKSLGMIFGFQSAMVFVVALPLFSVFHFGISAHPIFQILGCSIWLLGLGVEILADRQLKQFKARAHQPEQILDTGLWSISRHPNYVGEAILWWGLAIFAFTPQTWWVLISPIVMTWLLRYFTGVGPLEEDMLARKPLYAKYREQVPVFWPKKIYATASSQKPSV